MSVQAMSWVFENSKHKGNAFVVLLVIANSAKEDGTGAWPSVKTIGKRARVSDRTVQRLLPFLARSGELEIELGAGPAGTNLYSLPKVGGDNLSPGGVTHIVTGGVTPSVTGGVTNQAQGGDIAVSPEPSLKQPSIGQPSLRRPKTFVKPSIEQVTLYCQERKNSINPEHFFDYYCANGWKVGKNSMKDWKAAVRYWEQNHKNGAAPHDSYKEAERKRRERRQADLWREVESREDVPCSPVQKRRSN